jgi:AcrR family transcriptional regulator
MVYQTDETRNKILQIARSLFTDRGLFDTQMIDVAQALGMSRTTLYRYFQDKLDLALAILRILITELEGAWKDPGPREGLTARDRIGLYFRQVWTASGDFAGHLRYLAEFDAFFSGSRIPEGFREKMLANLSDAVAPPLLLLVIEGQADGSIRPDLDPHLAMSTLLNAVRGIQQRVTLRGEVLVELQPQEAERLVDELIGYLLRGVAPSGSL